MADQQAEAAGPVDAFRSFLALRRDVLVLSAAMFAFSLGFRMTSRYLPEYTVALGAAGFVVGLFGTFGNVISAVFPHPGGAVSDRVGSRYALTAFGALSTLGFAVWFVASALGRVALGAVVVEPWVRVFVGLVSGPDLEVVRPEGDVRRRQAGDRALAAGGRGRRLRAVLGCTH